MRSPPTLAAAVQAFEHYDLETSHRIYRAVAASPETSQDDRIAAHRALARDTWRFDRDPDGAIRELEPALALARRSDLLVLRGEIALDVGRLDAARIDADQAISLATGPTTRLEAELLHARVVLAAARAARDPDRPDLEHAAERVTALLAHQPGRPALAETLLWLAVLLDDGPGVLHGWRSRFLVADGAVPPLLREAGATLTTLAATWRGRPLTAPERIVLVEALAGSRLYDLAAWVAAAVPEPTEAIREIVAYQAFITGIQQVDDTFYPRVANGLRDYEAAYDEALDVHARQLWVALGIAEPYTRDGFFVRIRDRFGAEGYVGTTVGFYGLLLGHVLHDEPRVIEQYGYTGTFRWVSIDRMISRDFTSWYGTTNVGGWGTESTMFQVRAAYLERPFRRLGWVTDPEQRASRLETLARTAADDEVRCAADRYADPASVALRLELAACDELFAELRAQGLAGPDLALAFVSECLRLNVEATVFAHEGRHSLDQRYVGEAFAAMSEDERELRAKFSEVVFSENPKLALTGSILGPRLDEGSGHGRANRWLRTLLVDWMDTHPDQVTGLDRSRPLAVQLDLLTAAQLVAILRDADPLA